MSCNVMVSVQVVVEVDVPHSVSVVGWRTVVVHVSVIVAVSFPHVSLSLLPIPPFLSSNESSAVDVGVVSNVSSDCVGLGR